MTVSLQPSWMTCHRLSSSFCLRWRSTAAPEDARDLLSIRRPSRDLSSGSVETAYSCWPLSMTRCADHLPGGSAWRLQARARGQAADRGVIVMPLSHDVPSGMRRQGVPHA